MYRSETPGDLVVRATSTLRYGPDSVVAVPKVAQTGKLTTSGLLDGLFRQILLADVSYERVPIHWPDLLAVNESCGSSIAAAPNESA